MGEGGDTVAVGARTISSILARVMAARGIAPGPDKSMQKGSYTMGCVEQHPHGLLGKQDGSWLNDAF